MRDEDTDKVPHTLLHVVLCTTREFLYSVCDILDLLNCCMY